MEATSEKENRQLKKRFAELAEKSFRENLYTFTDFLGIAEQSVFHEFLQEYGRTAHTMWGGHSMCERQMVRFGSLEELLYEHPFPIVCIKIRPLVKKFADDLTHRDFLGALMNLGIERSTLGDIFVQDKEAYLYAQETMAGFIIDQLDKVRHTSVRCELAQEEPKLFKQEPQREEYLVSSERIDGVLSKIYKLSRSQSQQLFRAKKVYVAGRLCENNSYMLKEDDAVTVRGYGRFFYRGICYESKKGKSGICIDRW